MPVRIVRLGTSRHPDEGTRIGTVRRPPRGVPTAEFASGNWYDVWYPNLAPTVETMKMAQAAQQSGSDAEWRAFEKAYRAEMSTPDASRSIGLLAELSKRSNFSVGCYCEREARCHRSLLRGLLRDAGAELAE